MYIYIYIYIYLHIYSVNIYIYICVCVHPKKVAPQVDTAFFSLLSHGLLLTWMIWRYQRPLGNLHLAMV